MKKSVKINLGGLVLHVDEDAYELLRHYLDQLQFRFSQVPGESEILSDIETRMAELFQEKLVPGKEVINLSDAKEVIAIMGEPEVIGDTEEEEQAPPMAPTAGGRSRRMYRDPSNQRIGGVCSGLAAYFRIDPVFVRILFIVFTLTYGAGILIYFVLWAAIPEARTAAEKLEMYGEEVNVENIERQVRQEYPYDPETAGYQSPVRQNSRGTLIGRMVRACARIVLVFFKVLAFIIAGSLVIAGIALLGSIIGLAVSGKAWFVDSDLAFGGMGFSDVLGFFISPATATAATIGMIILIAVPIIGLIYWLVKAIFRFKAPNRMGVISLSGIWAVTLVVMIILVANQGVQYSKGGVSVVENGLTIPATKKLIIKTLPHPADSDDRMCEYNYHGKFWLNEKNDSVRLYIRPNVRIRYTQDPQAGITIRKSARGGQFKDARDFAEQIGYSYTLQDSLLVLDPVIELSERKRFHAQEVEVTINLPAGTVVYLDSSLRHLLYAVENSEDTWSEDMVGDEWLMTPDGLTRVLKTEVPEKKE